MQTGQAVVTLAKQAAARRIEAAAPELVSLSHRLHADPEPAFGERHASERCGELLTAAGFAVEVGCAGIPTAFRATSGRGALRVAFCVEYDALPGVGHACGHNVICAASLGAALGAAAVTDETDLAVIVLGTPGEELFGLRDIAPDVVGAGKCELLERGAFDGVHAVMMCHPAPVDIAAPATRGLTRLRAAFSVAAAGSPLLVSRTGLLPVDHALALCQTAAIALQSQLPDGCSIHLVQSLGCWGIRAHTDKMASVDFGIWGESLEDVEAAASKLEECARAAATATGTAVWVDRFLPYAPMRHDPDLAALYRNNAVARGRTFPDLGPLADHIGMATDLGTVSRHVAAIHPLIGIDTSAMNHQAEFAAACATPSADRAVIDGAVSLAWTAIDAATTPAIRDRLLTATART